MSERTAVGRGWKTAAPLVLALCGALLVISAKTSGGTDLRGGDLLEMTDLVRAEERRVQQLTVQAEEIQVEVERLTQSRGDDETRRLQDELDALRPQASMSPVLGPGLQVTLHDAPRTGNRQDLLAGVHIEEFIIHQEDLEAVMNALWAGGAEAMMVMDQRIGATSTVRCVGPVLQLEGRQYAPPYTISAIGDPDMLQAALDDSQEIAWIKSSAETIGLGYNVEPLQEITMPAYEGPRVTGTRS
ncbi:DUF881 domain-containing protein [Phytoactinopolyspora limicola]|uniref:DUF881 domain-containing protein n=1 Tax=Phytoactinopolyspora limicola TaxID=2715536 RepID=UPI001409147E|nr:DUF881 domain-containing protein [Phytoactinopolyspora limicola]